MPSFIIFRKSCIFFPSAMEGEKEESAKKQHSFTQHITQILSSSSLLLIKLFHVGFLLIKAFKATKLLITAQKYCSSTISDPKHSNSFVTSAVHDLMKKKKQKIKSNVYMNSQKKKIINISLMPMEQPKISQRRKDEISSRIGPRPNFVFLLNKKKICFFQTLSYEKVAPK